jgi:hypothetical protein
MQSEVERRWPGEEFREEVDVLAERLLQQKKNAYAAIGDLHIRFRGERATPEQKAEPAHAEFRGRICSSFVLTAIARRRKG